MKNNRGFHTRGFISFLTLSGFLVMSITGLVLYIVPYGRVAYWVDWRFMGLSKTDWDNIHIISSLLFLVAGSFHLYYNWRALMNYIINRISGGIKLRKELGLATVLSVIVVISAFYHLPPLQYVIDLNEYIKEQWVVSKEYEPPYGHAELTSLKVFAKKMQIDLEKTLAEFKRKGIRVKSTDDSLKVIAAENRLSPMDLYLVMKKYEEKTATPTVEFTPERVEELFAGSGVGRKKLPEICSEQGLKLTDVMERLEKAGIKPDKDDTLKKIAERNGINPLEVLKTILVSDYIPVKEK